VQPSGFAVSQAITLHDVAREADVSTATVSRVVHNLEGVRPATRQRVLDVIEALGYFPDGAAQSMARQRKEVIGLLAMDSRSPDSDIQEEGLLFGDMVQRGVEWALRDTEWSLLISLMHNNDPAAALRRIQKIAAKVDGMLVIEGSFGFEQLGKLAARIPVVLIAGSAHEPNADAFIADNRGGTTALVEHLVSVHGVRSLYEIAGPPSAPDALERHAALHEAVTGYGSVAVAGTFQGWFAAESGELAVRELLSRPRAELPDAIVSANDQMALGAIGALEAAGVRVPADIAVVGFDDVYSAAVLGLTTVRQPMRLLGERACSRLLQRLEDPSLARHAEYLPVELVIRRSCGCASPA
jgi:LacI family transcriptional regulator, galactose operon repressor